jgi:hypothetical protein
MACQQWFARGEPGAPQVAGSEETSGLDSGRGIPQILTPKTFRK